MEQNKTSGRGITRDRNGEKLYKKEVQINSFKGVWEQIFQISEEEYRDYGEDNERRVTEFLEGNKKRTEPY